MTDYHASPRVMNSTALSILRASMSATGTVNLPGDAEYSNKRWAGNAEKTAAIVACPATPDDVAQVLTFAQGRVPYDMQRRLDVAVKGGGHNASGASSSDGGLVIDLAVHMHDVRIDPKARLAYVGGGALWRDVDNATRKYGLAAVAGTVSHTGVGGLTLGGGSGWLCGQHGFVIDNLVAATVVTASGAVVNASAKENTDLYWALRGGGGNFGVVTEFVYRLHEQRLDIYKADFTFPVSAIDVLIPELSAWLSDRSIAETGGLVFMLDSDKKPVLILTVVYNGDAEEGRNRFKRFQSLKPIVHDSGIMAYTQLNQMLDIPSAAGDCRQHRGNFVPAVAAGFPIAFIKEVTADWFKVLEQYPDLSKSFMWWELFSPDNWSKVPSDATAYVHRSPTYNTAHIIRWSDPSFTPQGGVLSRALAKSFAESREKHFSPKLPGVGGGSNFLDEEAHLGDNPAVRRRFGSNYNRLCEVKKKYDPDNIFNKWFAIEPKVQVAQTTTTASLYVTRMVVLLIACLLYYKYVGL